MKTDHSVILAEMKVQVFAGHSLPVSIFRLHDSDVPASAITSSLTDQEIIAALNQTYNTQGNISFTLSPTSQSIDLKRVPPATAYYFNAIGVFNWSKMDPVYQITKLLTGADENTRLIIYIFENFDA